MTNFALPREVRGLFIAGRRDALGLAAANKAAERWQAEGRTVRMAKPPIEGQDFNDLAGRTP